MISPQLFDSTARNKAKMMRDCHFNRILTTISLIVLAVILVSPAVFAQTAGKIPFGIGDATTATSAPTGVVAWLLTKQAELTRGMIAALRATKSGAGAWTLITIAFLYGVFHAAGPGHGKAVVSSYIFANEQTLRRAVVIAFSAAVLQALVAITLVVPTVVLLGATARQIDASVAWIEIFAFAAIILLGLSLTLRKFKALRHAMQAGPTGRISCIQCDSGVPHSHGSAGHIHGPQCNHVHLPDAATLGAHQTWRDMAVVTVTAGIRPCSGAIILLAFALSVDALAAGIAAVFAMAAGTALTTAGFAVGAVLAKGLTLQIAQKSERLHLLSASVELVAAVLITLFGIALLTGYLALG